MTALPFPPKITEPSAAALILLLGLTGPAAAQQSSACSLLTKSDIEAATGVRPPDPVPIDYSGSGAWKGGTADGCVWVLGARKGDGHEGNLFLSVGRLWSGMTAQVAAKHIYEIEWLRAQHWAEEAKDFADAWCLIMTPPAGQEGRVTSCAAEVEGMMVSVLFTTPKLSKLSIDDTKALLDKAAARMR